MRCHKLTKLLICWAACLAIFLPAIFLAEETEKQKANAQISSLVQNLGADTWGKREVAQQKLLELSTQYTNDVLEQVLEAVIKAKDPEIRFRSRKLLREAVLKQQFVENKGFLGVTLQDLRIAQKVDKATVFPILVVTVVPESAAATNGFVAGDRIIQADDKTCSIEFDTSALIRYIKKKGPGSEITFVVITRKGQVTRKVQLRKRPLMGNDLPAEQEKEIIFDTWFTMNMDRKRSELKAIEKFRKQKKE